MKKFLGINLNKNLAKKGTIIALALAVVIGMSYFGSQDYLNMSIMDMLMGATHGGDKHWDMIQQIKSDRQSDGYTDIEVNKAQKDANGNKVSNLRPDVQSTSPSGVRTHDEVFPDTAQGHKDFDEKKKKLKAADPNCTVVSHYYTP